MENEQDFYEKYYPITDSKTNILIVDLETTGLNHLTDEIVEIGICKLNIKTGAIQILVDTLVKSNPAPDSWILLINIVDRKLVPTMDCMSGL